MKRPIHAAAPLPQQSDRDLNLPSEPDYLLTIEAADLLRFTGPHKAHLFRKWAVRNHVPVNRRGRTLLYERSVLRAFLQQKPWTVYRRRA